MKKNNYLFVAILICVSCSSGIGIMGTSKNNEQYSHRKIEVDPVIKIPRFLKDSTVNFDNLRFAGFEALNTSESSVIVTFFVSKVFYSYNGKSFASNGDRLGSEELISLYENHPKTITFDSVYIVGNDSMYIKTVDRIININYPEENRYTCMDTKKSTYNFEKLVNKESNLFSIQVDENHCNIVDFRNLGTAVHVKIFDANGIKLKSDFVRWGETNIGDFFEFSDFIDSSLKLEITGDYLWKGELVFK